MARNTDETKKIDKFIGGKLTDIICKHNISRKELAKSINVSVQQLNKYESGMNRISSSRLFLIAKALKKKTTFLYDVLKEYIELENVNSILMDSRREIGKGGSEVSEKILSQLRTQPDSTLDSNISEESEIGELEYA